MSQVQPRELREPTELIKDLICIPIAQCVTELAFDMNILQKCHIENRNASEHMIWHLFAISAVLSCICCISVPF